MNELQSDYLRRLRNEVAWSELLIRLRWVHKIREGRLVFQCPRCQETLSVVNERTNLGRCFQCKVNWNPIDFTIETRALDFKSAVLLLGDMLRKQ